MNGERSSTIYEKADRLHCWCRYLYIFVTCNDFGFYHNLGIQNFVQQGIYYNPTMQKNYNNFWSCLTRLFVVVWLGMTWLATDSTTENS